MPRAGELHERAQQAQLQRLVTQGVGAAFLLTMGFFIGAAFFGSTLIETWVGPGFQQSHILFLILLGTHIVAMPVEVFRYVLFGMGHVRTQAFINLAEAAANVALSLALIGPLGLLGVAIGTAIPVIVVEIGVLTPFALRKLEIAPSRLIRQALGPQLLALTTLLVYSFYVASNVQLQAGWLLLIAITIGGGISLAAGRLGFNWFERHLKSFQPASIESTIQ